jgi:UDP-GlcNAc:undecaprenyl-phosphate GlcNAc-1-phosphate transferase
VSGVWPLVAVGVAALTAALLATVAVRTAPPSLLVENRAGRVVPAILGWALVGGVVVGLTVVELLWPARGPPTQLFGGVALVAVLAAGSLDDLRGRRARGFRGHLGSLLRGRVTTGIVKLVVGMAVGLWLALWADGGPVRVAASALLIVVSINLWNALDVVPGRALKWGVLVLVSVLAVGMDRSVGVLAGAGLGAAVAVLPFDLRQRGMLGDAGSNPLGLLAGLGLALLVPTWGIIVAAAAALALQVAAETVTISRLIEAVPPLRWFDRLGRRT